MKTKKLLLTLSLLLLSQQAKTVELQPKSNTGTIIGAVAVAGIFTYLLAQHHKPKTKQPKASLNQKEQVSENSFLNYALNNACYTSLKDRTHPSYSCVIRALEDGANPLDALQDYLIVDNNGKPYLKITSYDKPKPYYKRSKIEGSQNFEGFLFFQALDELSGRKINKVFESEENLEKRHYKNQAAQQKEHEDEVVKLKTLLANYGIDFEEELYQD